MITPLRITVAPFAGAWIEIKVESFANVSRYVAPFAGAWIEMRSARCRGLPRSRSLPSRERGLKFPSIRKTGEYKIVAPFAGAWIEMLPECWQHWA